MNPIQKVVLIASLAASLITLIAQSVGGDVAALLTALAVSAVLPILLPRLFGMHVVMVDKEDLVEPAGRSSLPPSATAELSVRAAKEGFKPTKEQYLEAMDKDIQNCVNFMDKIDDLTTKHMYASQVNKMRKARELVANADEKEF